MHCDYLTAELVKLFCNVSRYAYFGIINGLTMIAMDLGVEPLEIIELANRDYPRNLHGKPGFTAGTCLRKDFGMLAEPNWAGASSPRSGGSTSRCPNTWSTRPANVTANCAASAWPCWVTPSRATPMTSATRWRPKSIRYIQRRSAVQDRADRSVYRCDCCRAGAGADVYAPPRSRPCYADYVFIAMNHSLYTEHADKIIDAVRRRCGSSTFGTCANKGEYSSTAGRSPSRSPIFRYPSHVQIKSRSRNRGRRIHRGYHLARRLAETPDVRLVVVDNFVRGQRDDLYRRLCAAPTSTPTISI